MISTSNPWAQLGVASVVNAAGKMTYLGSSRVSATVAGAMTGAGMSFVDMAHARAATGQRLAAVTGAPAAWVTASAAAGIVACTAATITGTDLAAVESVPDVGHGRREVVLAASHAVSFGAPLVQMVRLGGGRPVLVGQANKVRASHYQAALHDRTAAVLHVVSHHSTEGAPSLEEVVAVAGAAQVPVIVDAAAEVDLERYLAAGADLVVYSGHKAIGGPTSGLVLGAAPLVDAVAAQEVGVSRAMKVSKETLAGLRVAVEEYVQTVGSDQLDQLHDRLDLIVAGLPDDLRVRTERVHDGTRPIPRLRLTLPSPEAARDLVDRLEGNDPSVRTRNHRVAAGQIDLDPRELSPDDARLLGRVLTDLTAAVLVKHNQHHTHQQQDQQQDGRQDQVEPGQHQVPTPGEGEG